MTRPALFLDRDDTLIDTTRMTRNTPFPGDIVRPEQVQLIHGVAEQLARLTLARSTMALIVVSNQGGVARGHCTIDDVLACNRRLDELLWEAGRVKLTGTYFCPYHPLGKVEPYNAEHPWRKPSPGMFLAAAKDHGLDLARSWMIGDAPRDIQAATAAGIAEERALLIGPITFAQAIDRVIADKETP